MKGTDKRISSAKVRIKSIYAQLQKSFVCFLFENSDKILLLTGEGVFKFELSVIFKRNGCTVFSVGIITGITVVKSVDCKINVLGIFE